MLRRPMLLEAGDGGEFVPHAPVSTREAQQRGWYNSKSGADYTVFYWPAYGVYTVHDENLQPVNNYVTKSEREAVAYIQEELDKDYVAPETVKQLDPTWAFSNSLEATNGVDAWGGDQAVMNHNGDWIRFYWRVQDQGARFYVAHEYESGDLAGLPKDYEFILMPGERRTVYNTESSALHYNVRVSYTGPVPLPVDENGVAVTPSRAYILNGPVMTRLRALMGRTRG